MNRDTSKLCNEAMERVATALPHITRAMTVDRSVAWSSSDLKDACEALAAGIRLITDAIGRLESEH